MTPARRSPPRPRRSTAPSGSSDGARPTPRGVTPEPRPSAAVITRLRRELEQLDLPTREAKILGALLCVGTANATTLARIAKMPLPNVYLVIRSLVDRNLVERVPGNVACWASPGRDAVLNRLLSAQQERLRDFTERLDRARDVMAKSLPEGEPVAVSFVHMVPDPAEVQATYERLLATAQLELMMFTRPPYATAPGPPKPAVLEMLERGVSARVLYESGKITRPEFPAYHKAGVQARVVDELPVKLVVVDRRAVLIWMMDPLLREDAYPTTMLVEHEGFARFAADAFEHEWERARPLESAGDSPG